MLKLSPPRYIQHYMGSCIPLITEAEKGNDLPCQSLNPSFNHEQTPMSLIYHLHTAFSISEELVNVTGSVEDIIAISSHDGESHSCQRRIVGVQLVDRLSLPD